MSTINKLGPSGTSSLPPNSPMSSNLSSSFSSGSSSSSSGAESPDYRQRPGTPDVDCGRMTTTAGEDPEDSAVMDKVAEVLKQFKQSKKELRKKRNNKHKMFTSLHDAIYASLNSESCDPPSDIAVYPQVEPQTVLSDVRFKPKADSFLNPKTEKKEMDQTNVDSKQDLSDSLSANFNCQLEQRGPPTARKGPAKATVADKKSQSSFFDFGPTTAVESGQNNQSDKETPPSSFTADLRKLRKERQRYRRTRKDREENFDLDQLDIGEVAPSGGGGSSGLVITDSDLEQQPAAPYGSNSTKRNNRRNNRKQVIKQKKQSEQSQEDGAATKPICHYYHPNDGFKPHFVESDSSANAAASAAPSGGFGQNQNSILPPPPASIASLVNKIRAEYSESVGTRSASQPPFPYWDNLESRKPGSPLTQYPFVPVSNNSETNKPTSMFEDSNNFLASLSSSAETTKKQDFDPEKKYFSRIVDKATNSQQQQQKPELSQFSTAATTATSAPIAPIDQIVSTNKSKKSSKSKKCEASFYRQSILKKFCEEIETADQLSAPSQKPDIGEVGQSNSAISTSTTVESRN